MSRNINQYLYDPRLGKPLIGIRGEAFRTDTMASVATATSDNDGLLSFTGLDDSLTYKVMAYVPGDIRVWDERDLPQWHYLTTPLTSTSWDGDSYSTTAATLIDLSAVFGVPAGVKAVYLTVSVNDSGSAANDVYFSAGPGNTGLDYFAFICRASGLANDMFHTESGIVPCNADGNIYYSLLASGASTMDVRIRVWGYMI